MFFWILLYTIITFHFFNIFNVFRCFWTFCGIDIYWWWPFSWLLCTSEHSLPRCRCWPRCRCTCKVSLLKLHWVPGKAWWNMHGLLDWIKKTFFKIIVEIWFFEFSGVIIVHGLGYLHGDDPYERKHNGWASLRSFYLLNLSRWAFKPVFAVYPDETGCYLLAPPEFRTTNPNHQFAISWLQTSFYSFVGLDIADVCPPEISTFQIPPKNINIWSRRYHCFSNPSF